jgi:hypothetical protein
MRTLPALLAAGTLALAALAAPLAAAADSRPVTSPHRGEHWTPDRGAHWRHPGRGHDRDRRHHQWRRAPRWAPPRGVVVAPRPIWVPGHWAWSPYGWVWVPGHWYR